MPSDSPPPPNYMTPRGYERIRQELLWLEKTERPKVVAEVAYAASLGDRSENAEYIYGKKRLRQIDSRRRFLIKRLEIARLADPAQIRADVVRFGATVTIEDQDGNQKTWKLYGEDEVDVSAGVLSWRSPIALAMMGKGEGDEFTVNAPAGKRTYELVALRYDPCEALPEDLSFGSDS